MSAPSIIWNASVGAATEFGRLCTGQTVSLANTGRLAAEEQYDQRADFDNFVQSSLWGALRPPMLQVLQLPPKPELRGDLARLKERNEYSKEWMIRTPRGPSIG